MTDMDRGPRVAHWVLVVSVAVQGLSGVAGGFGMVSDPSGGRLGLPLEWLRGSSFPDYLVPGVVLLGVLGVVPLIVTYGLWTGRSWSDVGALLVGIALLVWLAVEIAVIGYKPDPPLQLVFGVLGVTIVLLAAPGAKRWISG